MIVATGGPMQNAKSSDTRNASSAWRHGVAHVTPLNATDTTSAAATLPMPILAQ
jgi:hypothetical protein